MDHARFWAAGPAPRRLDPGDVHVWLADVDRGGSSLEALARSLSRDERERADRFCFDRDRRRFIGARGILRQLLGRYLGDAPSAVAFEYGPHGKPQLPETVGRRLRFNASHSGNLAVFAFADAREMGVDIEVVRPMEDANDIAMRFFSPREVAELRSVPRVARNDAFFACWTRKEAYIKAIGDGLTRPLDTFDVTFAQGATPRLTVAGDPNEERRWSLMPLAAPPGYAAALVVERPVETVTCWTWTEAAAGPVGALDEIREAV